MGLSESAWYTTEWTITKIREGETEPYEVNQVFGNTMLNEGIDCILNILCGLAGPPSSYDVTVVRIGVGNSSVATNAVTMFGLDRKSVV